MNIKLHRFLLGIAALGAVTSGMVLVGCSSTSSKEHAASSSTGAGGGGAILWAQNCGHCHNVRSPDSLSDAQWDVVMLHMRVRGNLTAREHTEILAFLKSAH